MDDYWPQPAPLGRDLEPIRVPRDPGLVPAVPHAPLEPTGELGLSEALSLTLRGSPQLASFAWDIRAQESAIIQAGLLPNPELSVEIEDFAGSGEFSGFRGSQTTLAFGQLILLGGKLRKRLDVSSLERDLAGWDYETARVGALTRAASDFVETLADQQRLAVAADIEALAVRIHSTVSERVEAGKVSPVERTRARIELAQATLDRQRAERELEAARHRLAANWGSASPRFERAVGDLAAVQDPPRADKLLERIGHNPDLARWATEMALRRAAVALARSDAVPDLTLFGGPRWLEGDDQTVAVAGLSISIPLFDRNQGAILGARIRQAQAGALRQAAEVTVRADLAASWQALDAAHLEVGAVRDDVEPSARAAIEAAEEAFRQGKIGALELLDSQRTLFGVRRQLVDALASYHQAVIALERLIGGPLHEPPPPQPAGDPP
jgi:cobalt-zinc-cadmium efflux system outer membrane protein